MVHKFVWSIFAKSMGLTCWMMCVFSGMEVLQMDNLEMFNALLNLSTYHHPENIVLPKGSVQQAVQAFSKQEPASDCDWSLGVKVFSYLVIFWWSVVFVCETKSV